MFSVRSKDPERLGALWDEGAPGPALSSRGLWIPGAGAPPAAHALSLRLRQWGSLDQSPLSLQVWELPQEFPPTSPARLAAAPCPRPSSPTKVRGAQVLAPEGDGGEGRQATSRTGPPTSFTPLT